MTTLLSELGRGTQFWKRRVSAVVTTQASSPGALLTGQTQARLAKARAARAHGKVMFRFLRMFLVVG